MPELNPIGALLRLARGDRTQQQLADELGVSQAALQRWETGSRIPEGHLFVRMSKVLGVSIEVIARAVTETVEARELAANAANSEADR